MERYQSSSDTLTHGQSHETEANLDKEQLHGRLLVARQDWAGFAAKRQRQLGDWPIDGDNESKAQYDRAVLDYGRYEVEDRYKEWFTNGIQARLNGDDTSDFDSIDNETKRNMLAIEYWLTEQNLLRTETKATVEGKKTWKLINAFSRFLNSGTIPQRFAKGALFGIAAVIAGHVVGGAVAGAAIAGGAMVAAGRFARGYAAHHSSGMNKIVVDPNAVFAGIDPRSEVEDQEDLYEKLTQATTDMFERDTRKEQSKQRKAFAWGVGSVAMGATIAAVAPHLGWGGVAQAHADVQHGIPEASTATPHGIPSETHESAHITSEAKTSYGIPSELDSEHTIPVEDKSVSDVAHSNPDVVGHDVPRLTPEYIDNAKDAFDVEGGSGLIRENTQWAKSNGYKVPSRVMQKLMEQLHHAEVKEFGKNGIIDVKGVTRDTYLLGKDVRINAPGEATWRKGVVDFKIDWLAKHGYHPNGSHVLPTETTTHSIPEIAKTTKYTIPTTSPVEHGIPSEPDTHPMNDLTDNYYHSGQSYTATVNEYGGIDNVSQTTNNEATTYLQDKGYVVLDTTNDTYNLADKAVTDSGKLSTGAKEVFADIQDNSRLDGSFRIDHGTPDSKASIVAARMDNFKDGNSADQVSEMLDKLGVTGGTVGEKLQSTIDAISTKSPAQLESLMQSYQTQLAPLGEYFKEFTYNDTARTPISFFKDGAWHVNVPDGVKQLPDHVVFKASRDMFALGA